MLNNVCVDNQVDGALTIKASEATTTITTDDIREKKNALFHHFAHNFQFRHLIYISKHRIASTDTQIFAK